MGVDKGDIPDKIDAACNEASCQLAVMKKKEKSSGGGEGEKGRRSETGLLAAHSTFVAQHQITTAEDGRQIEFTLRRPDLPYCFDPVWWGTPTCGRLRSQNWRGAGAWVI